MEAIRPSTKEEHMEKMRQKMRPGKFNFVPNDAFYMASRKIKKELSLN